jgi:hypothetical protein
MRKFVILSLALVGMLFAAQVVSPVSFADGPVASAVAQVSPAQGKVDIAAAIMQVLSVVGAIALALPALLQALIVFFAAVPGPQPEAALQKFADAIQGYVDLIAKFSRKKDEKPSEPPVQ